MIEYTDGTFGPIMEASEVTEQLMKQLAYDTSIASIHFGTPEELGKIRGLKRAALEFERMQEALNSLENRVARMEEASQRPSSIIYLPTVEEMKTVLRGENEGSG